MYDVITVGSATVDAMACTEHCETLKGKQRNKFIAYPIGAKILVEDLILTIVYIVLTVFIYIILI